MKDNKIIEMEESIPVLIKNTHLNISLEGWPAALTAMFFFGSCVTIYAIKTGHIEFTNKSEEDSSMKKVA